MKVILKSTIVNVGHKGEIKDISAGFARNYLLPKNLVIEATLDNIKKMQKRQIIFKNQKEKNIAKAKEIASKIRDIKFMTKLKVGKNGKTFGSITATDLSELFKSNGFNINKRNILLYKNIKEIGKYEINIKLHSEVTVKVCVFVTNDK
ncbi:MAG: 50S ribosomal protein L9 [Endomicrobium sp.]|jgi:large subunit ribosomal protein L9|nr:50S ribosomal protein L9 [Endomicrobium sp.]